MSIDEQSRHRLFTRLEEVLGGEEATTLMDHLPPVGWADVATKRDLDHLAVATKGDLEHLRVSLENLRINLEREIQASTHAVTASFRGELVALQRHMVFALTGSMVSISALAFAIAQLIR